MSFTSPRSGGFAPDTNISPIPVPAWQIILNGRDITQILGSLPEHLMYEEQIGSKANHIELRFADTLQQMQNVPPSIGATLTVSLGYLGSYMTPCGTFQIDQYELEGPPDRFVVKGIQAGVANALRSHNSVSYEGQTLVQIANTVAKRNGLTAITDAVSPDVPYQRLTQMQENDLAFLHRIARQHNYDFQVRDTRIIFYSRVALEAMPPVGTITRDQISRFRIETQSLGKKLYSSATVSHFNPVTKTVVEATMSDPSVVTGDRLKAVERVENSQQASLRAAGYLHQHNKHKCHSTFTLPGTLTYRAGMMVNVQGFGQFDQTSYMIEKARHTVDAHGWITELTLNLPVATKVGGKSQTTIVKEDALAEPPLDQPGL